MRAILFISTFLFIASCSSQPTLRTSADETLSFQEKLNQEYLDPQTTPLRGDNFKKFKGHPFFPSETKYVVNATLEKLVEAKVIEFPTSSGKVKSYRPYAIAHFRLGHKPYKLTLYQSMDLIKNPKYKDYLFLPFKDLTNGKSTYGGGKYLDLRIPPKGSNRIVIDFNKSYHPYCAYNAYDYSCPIVPKENHLSIPIQAGVKYEAVYF